MYTIVGLGNPGSEYAETRHNTGRLAMETLEKAKIKGLKLVHIDTFMNKSGVGVAKVVKSKKAAEKLVVIYDDLDLPLGVVKMSYDRGSGGHKGVESIIRAIKTKAFIRVRVGIGKKEPVEKHILGKFTPREKEILKKVFKKVVKALEVLADQGLQAGMTECNTG
jgi:peptidyl-tRNA hydrolase, PTH1 family